MANTAAAIRATLGLDTAPLDAGLARAKSSTLSFARTFKSAMSGLAGAFGGGALAAGIRESVLRIKELNEEVKLTEEASRSLSRVNTGLSEEQIQSIADAAENYKAAGDAIDGFRAKFILGVKSLFSGGSFFEPFQKGGGFKGLLGGLTGEGPETQTLGVTAEDRKKIADAQVRADEKIKKIREEVAKIDNQISEAQQSDYESRLSAAEQIKETEKRIAEARAAQVGEQDEVKAAEARKREAEAVIKLEEQKRKKLKEEVDLKLAGPDARRQAKRDEADRRRAERTVLNRDRDAEEIARKNGRKLPAREAVGEVQGPQLPPGQAGATEATMKEAVTKLSTIAASLGVRL